MCQFEDIKTPEEFEHTEKIRQKSQARAEKYKVEREARKPAKSTVPGGFTTDTLNWSSDPTNLSELEEPSDTEPE